MDDAELELRKSIAWDITAEPPPPDPSTGIQAAIAAARSQADRTSGDAAPACAPPIQPGPSRLPPSVVWATGDPVPVEHPIAPRPDIDAPLPSADWLVITWTAAELVGLARVLAPSTRPDEPASNPHSWYDYHRNFPSYLPDLPKPNPYRTHPAIAANRLGRYFPISIGGKSVLLFKSELHLNQDSSIAYKAGRPLPLSRMLDQIIAEVKPKYFVSTGTAGGVVDAHTLGDTVVTTSGLFRCGDPRDFRNADFNCKQYGIKYWVDNKLFGRAKQLMATLQEPAISLPHSGYTNAGPFTCTPKPPNIHEFPNHPMLTTDFFEFGTTANRLDQYGCAVEMDDALLAMGLEGRNIQYCFVRNVSDPVINGALDKREQVMWALYYYENFGLTTSYNSALATWAIVAAV